jgi:hypothetical protein
MDAHNIGAQKPCQATKQGIQHLFGGTSFFRRGLPEDLLARKKIGDAAWEDRIASSIGRRPHPGNQ